jgi:hypothetical protein
MLDGMNDEEREKEIVRLTALLEHQKKAITLSRAMYKWILEFVRNCMVVAALFYLARRSGDWWVYGIAGVSGFALVAYCSTYVEGVGFDVKIPYVGWRLHATAAVVALVTQLLLVGITIGLYVTLDKIVTVQVQITEAP